MGPRSAERGSRELTLALDRQGMLQWGHVRLNVEVVMINVTQFERTLSFNGATFG